jgi:hypothetical protein
LEIKDSLAFAESANLATVTIPSSLVSFGENPFKGTLYYDNNLDTENLFIINNILLDGRDSEGDVVVPEGVVEIAPYAFHLNKLINIIIFSDSLIVIKNHAFAYSSLNGIVFGTGLTTIGNSAFSFSQLTELSLPEGLKEIGIGVFSSNYSLTYVSMPRKYGQISFF